uniref:RNase H type-1 domain-containing protein n=1 Tax=Cannabis sativa TaxID=3483 RepID=A0A803NHW6_CANSA
MMDCYHVITSVNGHLHGHAIVPRGLGFRNIRNWNIAAMGRYVWDIASKKDCLFDKWIHKVYLKDVSWWDYDPPSDCCWSWRKIVGVKNKLKQSIDLAGFVQQRYKIQQSYQLLFENNERLSWSKTVWGRIFMKEINSWLQWGTRTTSMQQLAKNISKSRALSTARKSILRTILVGLVYHIWKARNEVLWHQKLWHTKVITQRIQHEYLQTKLVIFGIVTPKRAPPVDVAPLETSISLSAILGQTYARSSTTTVLLFFLNVFAGQWAGREVLLKAVIQAIPAYVMACFRLPIKLCKGIGAAMARFWWGSTGNLKKIVGNPGNLYFPRSSILEAVPAHSPSFTWRSIIWERDLMASGLIWKIGDGEHIRTEEDHWIPNNKLKSYNANGAPTSCLLSYLIDDLGTWDLAKLRTHFEEPLINDILEVPVTGFHNKDEIIWERENSSIFSQIRNQPNHSATAPNNALKSVSMGTLQIFTNATIDLNCKKHSIGVVVMDELNQVKSRFSKPFLGSVPPAVAEAKAILQAIQWAQLIYLPLDVLKIDCKTIVDKLVSCNWNSSLLDDILICVKNLLSFSPNLTIVYVHRKSNKLAHKVAKLGLGLDNELVWNGLLSFL